MRVKEWFGWHFPELAKIVKDNYLYIRLVKIIKERKNLIENKYNGSRNDKTNIR